MTTRLESPDEAARWCAHARAAGQTLGFVPTMGALHAGHLALVERARAENARVAVSVFVNPLQFDDPADLERYPHDLQGDARLLEGVGCDLVFTGSLAQFFAGELDELGGLPAGRHVDPGPAASGLEGEFRPGHFAGVATILDRLFDVVRPDRAYFGRKDFQQCLVVRDLARRRGDPQVVLCETVREDTGLARSSRNRLLDARGRAQALFLPRALAAAAAAWDAGERGPERLCAAMDGVLAASTLALEYAEVRDPEAWSASRPAGPLERAVALVAARAGAVRLIDNRLLS